MLWWALKHVILLYNKYIYMCVCVYLRTLDAALYRPGVFGPFQDGKNHPCGNSRHYIVAALGWNLVSFKTFYVFSHVHLPSIYIYNFDINHYANTDDLGLVAMQLRFLPPSMLRFTAPAILVRFRMEKPSMWQQSTLYSGSIGLKPCEFQDGLCFFACASTIYIYI